MRGGTWNFVYSVVLPMNEDPVPQLGGYHHHLLQQIGEYNMNCCQKKWHPNMVHHSIFLSEVNYGLAEKRCIMLVIPTISPSESIPSSFTLESIIFIKKRGWFNVGGSFWSLSDIRIGHISQWLRQMTHFSLKLLKYVSAFEDQFCLHNSQPTASFPPQLRQIKPKIAETLKFDFHSIQQQFKV